MTAEKMQRLKGGQEVCAFLLLGCEASWEPSWSLPCFTFVLPRSSVSHWCSAIVKICKWHSGYPPCLVSIIKQLMFVFQLHVLKQENPLWETGVCWPHGTQSVGFCECTGPCAEQQDEILSIEVWGDVVTTRRALCS